MRSLTEPVLPETVKTCNGRTKLRSKVFTTLNIFKGSLYFAAFRLTGSIWSCSMDSSVVEDTSIKEERKFVFKDPNFSYYLNLSSKKKIWKSLKQVISQERNLSWPKETMHYSSIVAPPSFKPAKKYSDISGLPAKYIDPQTKLYYSNADEFSTVRSLPSDIISGYLALRGEHNPIG